MNSKGTEGFIRVEEMDDVEGSGAGAAETDDKGEDFEDDDYMRLIQDVVSDDRGINDSGDEIGDDEGYSVQGGQNNSDQAKAARKLVMTSAFTCCLTSILLGYDVGVMSGAILYITKDLGLADGQEELIVGSLNLVAAVGGLLAGKISDAMGRRMTIFVACLIFIVGASIMALSNSFEVLLLGRVITGIGVGCSFVIAPVYTAEITPPNIRGFLLSLTDVMINIGIVLGYLVAYACAEGLPTPSLKWRVMLGIGLVPPLCILVLLMYLPESPRWLLSQQRVREGFSILKRIEETNKEARDSLVNITKSLREEARSGSSWADIFCPRTRHMRRALLIGLGLGFFQQITGSEAVVYYSPTILRDGGFTSTGWLLLANVMVGCFKLGGEGLAMFYMDGEHGGRRPFFLASAVGMTASLVLLASSFVFKWPFYLTLLLLCAYMWTFSVGIGVASFMVASEICPVRQRGKAVSIVVFVNRLVSGTVATSFLSLQNTFSTGGTFYLFGLVSFLSIAFYYYCVPETKGRTLEEIAVLLGAKTFSAVGGGQLPPSLPPSPPSPPTQQLPQSQTQVGLSPGRIENGSNGSSGVGGDGVSKDSVGDGGGTLNPVYTHRQRSTDALLQAEEGERKTNNINDNDNNHNSNNNSNSNNNREIRSSNNSNSNSSNGFGTSSSSPGPGILKGGLTAKAKAKAKAKAVAPDKQPNSVNFA